MPRTPSETFTDKELEIISLVWEFGEASARQLQERLPGDRHYNNVMTLVRVLEKKGHLRDLPAEPPRPIRCQFSESVRRALMRHPFESIPRAVRRRLFLPLLAAAVLVLSIRVLTVAPMSNGVAPLSVSSFGTVYAALGGLVSLKS